MEPNYEKEVALLTQKLQEETVLRIRYQALLDDALEEIETLKTPTTSANNDEQKYNIVESA